MWPFNKKEEKQCQLSNVGECSLVAKLREKQKKLDEYSFDKLQYYAVSKLFDVDIFDAEKIYFNNIENENVRIIFDIMQKFYGLDRYNRDKILKVIIDCFERNDEYMNLKDEIDSIKNQLGIR
jgi:hypothetical protein